MKHRYVLPALIIDTEREDIKEAVKTFEEPIKRMANVKEVRFEKLKNGKKTEYGKIDFDWNITPELIEEWLVSDLIRIIQRKRKEVGLKMGERIILRLPKNKIFEKAKNKIEIKTGSKIVFGE
jgi:hypothetical protein